MKNKLVKEFLVLPILSIITAFLLSLTYVVTKDTIAASEKNKMDQLRKEVVAAADTFKQVDVSASAVDGLKKVEAYLASNGKGAAIQTTVKGYGGDLVIITGIDENGKVLAVKVVSTASTPGLGSKTENSTFLSQFVGSDKNFTLGKTSGDGSVVAVTGATVSSKAMLNSVNAAKSIFEKIKGEL